LRATDLLLQSGGFGLIVMDLGSTPAEMSWRIPLATWFRYRAACERTHTSLLLLTRHPCARSSAEVVARMQPGAFAAHERVFTGMEYRLELERQRFQRDTQRDTGKVIPIRKGPQSERPGSWKGRAAWAL
jgi:recombination protein RecA